MSQPTTPPQRPSHTYLPLLRHVLLLAMVALAVLMGVQYLSAQQQPEHSSGLASAPVSVVSAVKEADGIHVRAHVDAPSPDGTTHELTGVIPEQTWALSQSVWACYPPKDPRQGFLRSPLDPTCSAMPRR